MTQPWRDHVGVAATAAGEPQGAQLPSREEISNGDEGNSVGPLDLKELTDMVHEVQDSDYRGQRKKDRKSMKSKVMSSKVASRKNSGQSISRKQLEDMKGLLAQSDKDLKELSAKLKQIRSHLNDTKSEKDGLAEMVEHQSIMMAYQIELLDCARQTLELQASSISILEKRIIGLVESKGNQEYISTERHIALQQVRRTIRLQNNVNDSIIQQREEMARDLCTVRLENHYLRAQLASMRQEKTNAYGSFMNNGYEIPGVNIPQESRSDKPHNQGSTASLILKTAADEFQHHIINIDRTFQRAHSASKQQHIDDDNIHQASRCLPATIQQARMKEQHQSADLTQHSNPTISELATPSIDFMQFSTTVGQEQSISTTTITDELESNAISAVANREENDSDRSESFYTPSHLMIPDEDSDTTAADDSHFIPLAGDDDTNMDGGSVFRDGNESSDWDLDSAFDEA